MLMRVSWRGSSPGSQDPAAGSVGDLLDFSPEALVHRTATGRETADAFLVQYAKWLETVTDFRTKVTRARKGLSRITRLRPGP